MVKLLKDLPVGTKVVDANTKYNGATIVWLVGGHNHYATNQTVLVSERILTLKAFDAQEMGGSPYGGSTYGFMRWSVSNIAYWLNSTSLSWYANRHPYDNPPSKANVYYSYNAYSEEKGFLANFSDVMLSRMAYCNIKTAYPPDSSRVLENYVDRVFLLSDADVFGKKGANLNGALESDQLPLFTDNSFIPANPTPEAVAQSEFKAATLAPDKPYNWWLRTGSDYTMGYVRVVDKSVSATLRDIPAYYGDEGGVRPAINLYSNTPVTLVNGVYTILPYDISPIPGTSLGAISKDGVVLNYTIGNLKASIVVSEYIDGVHLGDKTVENGKTNSLTIPYDMFKSLKYGRYKDSNGNPHVISLVSSGETLATYSFYKSLPNDAKTEDVLVAVNDMSNTAMSSHKKKLVSAIGNKATVGGTGTLEDIAKAIESISGKRFATGTTATVKASHQVAGQVGGTVANTLQISGLGFAPTILIYKTAGDGSYVSEIYFKDGFRDGANLWSFKNTNGHCYSCNTAVIREDLVYVPSFVEGTKDWVAIG